MDSINFTNKLNERVAAMTNGQIFDCLSLLQGPATQLTEEENIVRGTLLTKYEQQVGEDACDVLMTAMGM